MKSGIYCVTNLVNGKKYVGKAHDLNKRLRQHRINYNSNEHLQNAIKRYGIENFEFRVLEYCTIDNLWIRERFWISFYDSYKNGYNGTDGGEKNEGWHHSETTKQKMKRPKSEEHCHKISIAAMGNRNFEEYWSSEENRAKQSEKTEELWQTEEYRNSRLEGQRRYSASEKKKEDDKKRGIHSKEYNNRPEVKEKQSKKMKGNTYGAGRKHIHLGEEGKMVYPNELDYYLSIGYEMGRPPKIK